MKINQVIILLFSLAALFFLASKYYFGEENLKVINSNNVANATTTIVYKNEKYGFSLVLEKDWFGYSEFDSEIPFGRQVILNKSFSTTTMTKAFIPILIYPIEKWKEWEENNFQDYPTAAPIGPSERGRNSAYVFATAPRYNFNYLDGFEEVENIISGLKSF